MPKMAIYVRDYYFLFSTRIINTSRGLFMCRCDMLCSNYQKIFKIIDQSLVCGVFDAEHIILTIILTKVGF
jgi:hypothetical protein